MQWMAAAAMALSMAAVPAWAQDGGTLKKIKDTGEVVIGVRDASIPFSYLDGDGASIGYSVDLCMKVVERLRHDLKMPGLKVRQQPVTSANRIPLVVNGTVDLECGSTVNNLERQKTVAFSLTTFVVTTKLSAKKASGIKTPADLKGKNLAVTGGTNTLQKMAALNKEQDLGMRIVNGKDHAESFLLVESDRGVAFAEDDILLAGLIASSRSPESFEIVAIPGMLADPYALVMRRDDPQFKAVVDGALRDVFKSGEIAKIYDKWFIQPIAGKKVALNFPMNSAFKKAVAAPTDSGSPQDYR